MQFRLAVALVIFVGSYLPLSLILLAQDYDYAYLGKPICWQWFYETADCTLPLRNPAHSLSIFAACLVCFLATIVVLWISRPKRSITIQSVRYVPSELMNYTLPYVVSFMSIEYHDTGKFVGLIIFLAWMFWITYCSGQIILNPLLIAFGWRLYEISYVFPASTQTHEGLALAHAKLMPRATAKHAVIQDVIIIKGIAEGGETDGGD